MRHILCRVTAKQQLLWTFPGGHSLAAARRVVREQRTPDDTHDIEYQDADGVWRTETARGDDRPEVDVTG